MKATIDNFVGTMTKGKSVFATDEFLTKMLYLATMEGTKKQTSENWGEILGQLTICFPEWVEPCIR